MKTTDHKNSGMRKWNVGMIAGGFLLFSALGTFSGCTKAEESSDLALEGDETARASSDLNFAQINLVSDVDGYGAQRTDANLVNPWGFSLMPDGSIIIAANGSGKFLKYDRAGRIIDDPVNMGIHGQHNNGTPTGVVYNFTGEFKIPRTGEMSRFIFAGEDGAIYAYSSGDSAHVVIDNSLRGAVYKGIEIARNGSAYYLYAADFRNHRIDVFDSRFTPVARRGFTDADIPFGFAPFNIKNVSGKLFVTYAMQSDEGDDDLPGRGNGYVDIFSPDGTRLARFATQGSLNSPWGIAVRNNNTVLIGNFGDGRINAYTMAGGFLGQLHENGVPISIPGLWGIGFVSATDNYQLYFSAGPSDESHGLFGYLKKRP